MSTSIRVALPRVLTTLSLLSVFACTDLTETPKSAVTTENFFRNEAEVLAGVAGVYAQLRNDGALWGYYNLSEITTDEMIVPTRGPDWGDNGRWLELHRQNWSASSPAGLEDMNRAWGDSFKGVAYANAILDALDRVEIPSEAQIRAELRVMRGFYYYLLMDMFGGVPIAIDVAIKAREKAPRDSVFRFIEAELIAAQSALPDTRPASESGRLTKSVVDAILANMYLNAGVFDKASGVSATAYNSCAGIIVAGGLDACDAAIQRASNVINSGLYTLNPNWRKNFTADNNTSPENIFVAKNVAADGLGLNLVMRALHYNQFNPSPWNGFATTAERYRAYDLNDERRKVILQGQQYDQDRLAKSPTDSVMVCARPGTIAPCTGGSVLLKFTDTIGNAVSAKEDEGPRILKYAPDPNHVLQENGNDYVYFRLAEMYFIRAEATFVKSGGGLADLNASRARLQPPLTPLATISNDIILSERSFEFAGEGKRRQDLIRFGKYTTWTEATLNGKAPVTEDFRILMPIPSTQLGANPLLVQNPGY